MSGSGAGPSLNPPGRPPGADPCEIVEQVQVASPNADALKELKRDDTLGVEVRTEQRRKILVVVEPDGTIVGSIRPRRIADVLDCVAKGVEYTATVVSKNRGLCIVEIRRA